MFTDNRLDEPMQLKKISWKKWIVLSLTIPLLGGSAYLMMGRQEHRSENDFQPAGACSKVADRVQDFYWTHGRLPVNYDEIKDSLISIQDRDAPRPEHTFTWELREPLLFFSGVGDPPLWGDPQLGDRNIHVTMVNTQTGERYYELGTTVFDFHLAPIEQVWTIWERDLPNGEGELVNSEVNLAHTMAADIDTFIQDYNRLPTLDDYPARSINPLTIDLGELGVFNEFTFWVEGEVSSGTINVASMVSGRIYQYPLRPGFLDTRRPRIIEPEF